MPDLIENIQSYSLYLVRNTSDHAVCRGELEEGIMKHKCSLKRFLSLLLAMGIIIASALPSTGQRVLAADASASAAESLVAHYKFDGNFKDTSSDSTGTAEGGAAPTLTSDSVRRQVMKSGSGFSWIKTSNPLYEQEGLDGFTVGAWVKANAVDTFNGIWSFASGNGNTNGFFGMSTNGSLYFNDNPSNPTYQDMTELGSMARQPFSCESCRYWGI